MNELLTVMVTWLSINFGLPAIYEHPQVEIVSATKITALRYRGLISVDMSQSRQDIVAVYDDASRTIYLPVGWTGKTPAETSTLLHEMVHHLQNVAQIKHECPEAREKLAYVAQQRWLERFGLSLEKEFKIDPLTLLVRTGCIH